MRSICGPIQSLIFSIPNCNLRYPKSDLSLDFVQVKKKEPRPKVCIPPKTSFVWKVIRIPILGATFPCCYISTLVCSNWCRLSCGVMQWCNSLQNKMMALEIIVKFLLCSGGGGHRPESRNRVRTTIGCFLFIGKKQYINVGSTTTFLNCETCDYT